MSYTDAVNLEESSYGNDERAEYLKVLDSAGRLAKEGFGKAIEEFGELF